ncbi:MAG: nuclease [Armatimonadota bacterium]|nr:nuclease [Armatimonadota bacterium]
MVIILDTFPASSAGKRPGKIPTLLDQCRQWISDCEAARHTVLVPAIVYYEALRELELRQAAGQIARFKAFCLQSRRFFPLTTMHLETAAGLWGQARRSGRPTAAPQALDVDVILAAQALSLGLPTSDFIVATTNPGHLSQFVPCDLWTNIRP